MSKLYFIGRGENSRKYAPQRFEDVLARFNVPEVTVLGVDTETNVTDSILSRVLKVISVSWEIKGVTDMAVFEFSVLNQTQKEALFDALKSKICIMHNASFDYQILKKYGCRLEKIHCTMLGEQILTTGLADSKGQHSLKAILLRRFDLDISKEEQTSFGEDEPLRDGQIYYAAIDVYKLIELYRLQRNEMEADDEFIGRKNNKGLMKTLWWENEFVKVVGDMETTGVYINRDRWFDIINEVQPIYESELKELNRIVIKHFKEYLIMHDYFSEEDRLDQKIWTSSKKKLGILEQLFPGLEKTSEMELKKYLRDHDPEFPSDLKTLTGKTWNAHPYTTSTTTKYAILKILVNKALSKEKKKEILDDFIVTNFRDYLISENLLIPAGTLTFSWTSNQQKKGLFREINPELDSVAKDVLLEIVNEHEIFAHYIRWAEVDYQLKSFGINFYENGADIDGRFRTRFNQILATGRLSSVKPNLLNIPGDAIYRKCFEAREGHHLIGADYDGQELVVMATTAKEPVWLDALKHGHDLHSVNASLTYGDEWTEGALPDCEFEGDFQKCECPTHQRLRTAVKTVVFSSSYGGTYKKIAFLLKIDENSAKNLLRDFYERLPKLKEMMEKFKAYVREYGRIVEPVFGRSRFYDNWKLVSEMDAVERASQNYPIQSASGAILKISMVLLRRWINHNGLDDKIFILLTVHDEAMVEAMDGYQELAAEKVAHFMKLGAKIAGYDIGAKALIGPNWGEIH